MGGPFKGCAGSHMGGRPDQEERYDMTALRFAFHNIVIHPICGVLWLIGATTLADRIHGDQANDRR